MELALIMLTSCFATLGSASVRLFEERVQKSHRDLMAFMTSYVFLGGVVFLLTSRMELPASGTGWLLAVIYGVCYSMANIGNCESFLCGPMSLTSVITSCSVLIPIVFGCAAYGEVMTLPHLLGIGFLIGMFVLTGVGSGGGEREISPRWLLTVLLSFVGSGVCAVITVVYSRMAEGTGRNGFLAMGFFCSAAILLVYALCAGPKDTRQPLRLTWGFAGTSCLTALGSFVSNGLMLCLSATMDTTVLYPLYNGLNVVLLTVVSCLAFRERMTGKKLMILLVGICAIVLMNL